MKQGNGRFRKRLHPEALQFSSSLSIDQRLYREDIEGSIAHVMMLGEQRIIPLKESKLIRTALREILKEIERGVFDPGLAVKSGERFVAEDIHMAIEHRLTRKIGVVGRKLHTGRSRNDQIALDEWLFLRSTIKDIQESLRKFQNTLIKKAETHSQVILPGYTHLQQAQPVLLAHHLLAYVSMLERDYERFTDCLKRINRSPLGAAALAGTSLPINREQTAKYLGFEAVITNSIDAVSDRDVQIEFLSACSIAMMHLSRFAEELILWSSQEWRFVEIGDEYSTGSSIMPQKKNPDLPELIRGKTGRVYGNLLSLLTVMKGLPLAYNRDMQEDKEPLFDSADTIRGSLSIFSGMMKSVRFNPKRFKEDLESGFTTATDVAEYLVKKGIPFRTAHTIVGSIVQECIKTNRTLKELTLEEYQEYSRVITKDIYSIIDPYKSLMNKQSSGSTSPKEVRRALTYWKKKCQ